MSESQRGAALRRAAAVKSLIQGEVLEVPDACVVIADASWPLDERSVEAAAAVGGSGLVVVPEPVDLVALLTQTCDLQQTKPDSRLCQLAPVVQAEDLFVRQASRGHRPGWVALPWHSANSLADLSRITTFERSVLIGAHGCGRPSTPRERLAFAEAISRHFTRTALPDAVCDVIGPFLSRIKEKHDRFSPEGRCIGLIATLRIEATPDIDDPSPSLRLLVILEANDLAQLPEDVECDQDRVDELVARGHDTAARQALDGTTIRARREGWDALAELWTRESVALAESTPGVDAVDVEVLSGDELSFTRLRNAPELDLAYLTSRVA